MADMALGWFAGRNAASKPVFDRRRGLVFDGIDGHRLNLNSGAESNIEAGLAFATSARWRRTGGDVFAANRLTAQHSGPISGQYATGTVNHVQPDFRGRMTHMRPATQLALPSTKPAPNQRP
jgi:hypothetical protein